MGFSTLLDILGSTVIGALLLLILFRINDTALQNSLSHAGELQVQEGLVEAVSVIEYDFRKMGYCENWEALANPSNSIIYADTSKISFLTDLPTSYGAEGDGIVDTLHYFTGPTSELSETDNPNDRLLYRVVNSATPVGSNIGITKFHLTYYDSFGNEIPTPITYPTTGSIYTLQIDLELQSVYAYKNNYNSVFWRQIRLAARNLRNR
jgi:hypothetical protein